jgi:CubicO group peptidase (beta-lactamase class C family)
LSVLSFQSIAFCLFSVFKHCCECRAVAGPANKNDRTALFRESVDKILNELDRKKGPGMAVWVEVDGEVVYSKWAGLAQREQRVPIDGRHHYLNLPLHLNH